MSGKVIHMSHSRPESIDQSTWDLMTHEAKSTVDDLVVDHLDGIVGEAEIEKAQQQGDPLEPNWSFYEARRLASDRARNAFNSSPRHDAHDAAWNTRQELNAGGSR